jgi:hypothetical protein
LQEARCFEFIFCIDEDPLGIKRQLDKFIDDAEPAKLQLREAKCGFSRWPVEILSKARCICTRASWKSWWPKRGRHPFLHITSVTSPYKS